jgi:hypothetical protein
MTHPADSAAVKAVVLQRTQRWPDDVRLDVTHC